MKDKILNLLTEIRPEFDFSEPVNFIEQGMLDSFDIVILVTSIEEKFGILVDGMDILPENFSSIDKIEALINKKGVRS
jgi:acyl carrier protein